MKIYLKNFRFLILLFLIGIPEFGLADSKKDIIVIQNKEIPKSEKEALIILPGFGNKKKRRKKQKAFFSKFDYDLYIPDYHSKKSFAATVDKFADFYAKHELAQYKKVHVFAYILGSWTINEFVKKEGVQNIKTIIYDRSPLQERAPRIVVDKFCWIGKLVKGKLLLDFSEMEYPEIEKNDLNIGIIVETKATKFIRLFKKKAKSYGEIDWEEIPNQQTHDDLIFTPLHHIQMYERFDIIGADIIHFLEFGKFKENAQRTPYNWNPYEKWKE